MHVWSDLCIATVIKRTEKKRVVAVTRSMTRGTLEQASRLLQASRGGTTLNTAFIERLNGTMRERLATLTRQCRHATRRLDALSNGMYLIGSPYNFCWPHQELSKTTHRGFACTPAMASGLTDHLWSVSELLSYRVAPGPGLSRNGAAAHPASRWLMRLILFDLSFVFAKGSYAPPPVSGVLPLFW